ncbi:hypothetical protein [Streptomyces shenzhenensis]|uniref:Guanylate cyclase domain-containing protein n=1 Tax=Streptomyces shenzhenensis TaxID=943815 RepID=A0A3M0IAL6_9ACTN|nr:hypothetical protein [Streptomyces shenzhenensis]RMB85442.1 hypothetical protein CTZ28_11565 [Streptomyces shenzhenensis]
MSKRSRSVRADSCPLPPYFGLLAVDAKDSTRLPSVQHAPLSRTITEIIYRGLEFAGLGEMRREFECNTGDGLAFGFDPSWLPLVISPFADVLDTLLQRHNTGADPHIRLRMSIHVGPVPVASGTAGDGNAAPRSEAHRLLDCEATRRWLADAGEDGTPLVVIVSDAVHRAAVLGGYCAVPPSRFTEVRAEVAGKGFTQTAWMYVPSPSGGLLSHPTAQAASVLGATKETDGASPAAPRPIQSRIQHVTSGVAIMDSTLRDVHHHEASRRAPDRS